MIRLDAQSTLVGTLPAIACTPDKGADDMLKAIRGYTADEVVTAAAIAQISAEQSRCLILALASRSNAKEARKASKEAA